MATSSELVLLTELVAKHVENETKNDLPIAHLFKGCIPSVIKDEYEYKLYYSGKIRKNGDIFEWDKLYSFSGNKYSEVLGYYVSLLYKAFKDAAVEICEGVPIGWYKEELNSDDLPLYSYIKVNGGKKIALYLKYGDDFISVADLLRLILKY